MEKKSYQLIRQEQKNSQQKQNWEIFRKENVPIVEKFFRTNTENY